MKNSQVRTVRDAIRKALLDEACTRSDKLSSDHDRPLDPRIGVLCRRGKPVYYAIINGMHCESTLLAAIEDELARA